MRWTILAAVVLAVLAGSLGWYWSIRLPPPQEASREELFRWLALRDLRGETPQTRAALMERLQDELLEGLPAVSSGEAISEVHRQRVLSNAQLLTHLWFVTRVQQYQQLEPDQRIDFLQRQIATLTAWAHAHQQLESGQAASPASQSAAISQLFTRIEQWMSQAEPQLGEQMKAAVHDGVIVWLATSDLSSASRETQREVAERLAEALRQSEGGADVGLPLNEQQHAQLLASAQLLTQAWFYSQSEQYHQLPEAQRTQFVDQRIDEISRWNLSELITGAPAGQSSASDAVNLVRLVSILEQWIAEAPLGDQEELRALAAHVQQRLLWRRLQTMFRTEGAAAP